MNFSNLVDEVSRRTGYPREEARVICEEFVATVRDYLRDGRDVRIKGLGAFIWRLIQERKLKHPETGEEVVAQARPRLLFRPAMIFRKGWVTDV